MRGGLKYTPKTDSQRNFAEVATDATPASVDWRSTAGVVNSVQNQQQCGSCWAFSATASVESRWAIKSKTLLKLSEQQLVDCDTEQDQGCNGGLMDNAFTYLETNAMELETAYPYSAVDGTCTWKKSLGKVTVVGFTDVKTTSEDLAAAISTGPVSVAVAANDYWQMYSGGVATIDDCPNDQLDHGVVAVGYTADYWIVRNSWGPSWGESG
jgi:C1A family cysteine protease